LLIHDFEVQNGRHPQYLHNERNTHLEKTLSALTLLAASCQREILKEAATLFEGRPRKRPLTAQEYSAIAIQGEFDSFDERFLGKHMTDRASYIDLF
jgi:hypothetical protein